MIQIDDETIKMPPPNSQYLIKGMVCEMNEKKSKKSKQFWIFAADGFICKTEQMDGGKNFKKFGNYFKTLDEAIDARNAVKKVLKSKTYFT